MEREETIKPHPLGKHEDRGNHQPRSTGKSVQKKPAKDSGIESRAPQACTKKIKENKYSSKRKARPEEQSLTKKQKRGLKIKRVLKGFCSTKKSSKVGDTHLRTWSSVPGESDPRNGPRGKRCVREGTSTQKNWKEVLPGMGASWECGLGSYFKMEARTAIHLSSFSSPQRFSCTLSRWSLQAGGLRFWTFRVRMLILHWFKLIWFVNTSCPTSPLDCTVSWTHANSQPREQPFFLLHMFSYNGVNIYNLKCANNKLLGKSSRIFLFCDQALFLAAFLSLGFFKLMKIMVYPKELLFARIHHCLIYCKLNRT